MPLPLISARLPSALNSTIRALGAGVARRRSAARRPRPRCGGRTRRTASSASVVVGSSARLVAERDEEVVAESVVFDELQRATSPSTSEGDSTAACTGSSGSDATGIDVHPAYAGVAPEPALLADGELPGPHDDRRHRLVERGLALDVVEQLLVAERLAGRDRQVRWPPARSPRRAGRASIIDCTRCSMRSARAARGHRIPICTASVGGNAPTPGPNELNGRPLPSVTSRAAHDASPVVRLHLLRPPPGRARAVAGTAPRCRRSGLQLGTDVGPGAGHLESVEDRGQIQAGPGDEQRSTAATVDRRDRGVAGVAELGDRHLRGRLDEIEAVVRHRGPVLPRSAWPCRCPCRGTPASRRPRRSRFRAPPAPRPWRRPTCRTPSDRG